MARFKYPNTLLVIMVRLPELFVHRLNGNLLHSFHCNGDCTLFLSLSRRLYETDGFIISPDLKKQKEVRSLPVLNPSGRSFRMISN